MCCDQIQTPENPHSPHGNYNPLERVIKAASNSSNYSWCTCSEEICTEQLHGRVAWNMNGAVSISLSKKSCPFRWQDDLTSVAKFVGEGLYLMLGADYADGSQASDQPWVAGIYVITHSLSPQMTLESLQCPCNHRLIFI